jgi:RNA polymerase sigma factor (sigma-70 family)
VNSNTEQTIREVLSTQQPRFLRFLRRRARAPLDANDLLQTASAKALSCASQLQDASKAEAWVMRVVRSTLLDALKQKQPLWTEANEETLSTPEETEPPCWCVLSQSKQIKAEYQEILRRVVIEETPVHIAAKELGLTPNNAMVRLHRARRALQEQMQRHCGTTEARACVDCGCDERGCCPPV